MLLLFAATAVKVSPGIYLGTPTGLTLRVPVKKLTWVDGMAGWYAWGGVSVHANFVFGNYMKVEGIEQGNFYYYLGGRGAVWGWSGELDIAGGFVGGIGYSIAPFDFSFEVALLMRVYPSVSPETAGGIAIRWIGEK